jgi:small GTP-binding protein
MSESDGGKKAPGCKVVLLGDSGVGKTCLISRYISGVYDSNSASTNGASYASKEVTYEKLGKTLMLDIWDTAGQEKYKALTKFFYKDAAVAILVYDITLKESFENLKEYWYKQIQENGDKNMVLGIAGNKSDLYEEEAVPEAEAREFATSVGAIFQLTSAATNAGVEKLFSDVGNKYLDPNFQQKLEEEKVEKEETTGPKITLDKDEVKKKEKKKKSFC